MILCRLWKNKNPRIIYVGVQYAIIRFIWYYSPSILAPIFPSVEGGGVDFSAEYLMSLALTTIHKTALFRGVSIPNLSQHASISASENENAWLATTP